MLLVFFVQSKSEYDLFVLFFSIVDSCRIPIFVRRLVVCFVRSFVCLFGACVCLFVCLFVGWLVGCRSVGQSVSQSIVGFSVDFVLNMYH